LRRLLKIDKESLDLVTRRESPVSNSAKGGGGERVRAKGVVD